MKHLKLNILTTLKTCLVVSTLASMTANYADDTEVFATQNISNNLLFIMDVSGSMRKKIITTTTDGGVTTTSGGTPGEFDQVVTNSTDDATQLYADAGAATAGPQVVDSDELNFVPGNIVATRFKLIDQWGDEANIPQGATITNAKLSFYATQDNAEDTTIDIYIEDAADNYAYSTYYFWNNYTYFYYHSTFPTIQDRPEFGPVTWFPSAWTAWSGGDRGVYNSNVDITRLVQQVVDKNDWDTGSNGRDYINSLAFKFITRAGERHAYAYEKDSRASAELRIEYEYQELGPPHWEPSRRCRWPRYRRDHPECEEVQTTVTKTGSVFAYVRNGYEDAEQEWNTPAQGVITDEQTLSFTDDKLVAIRFALANQIPVNSVITNAYIQFTAASNASADADINIQIENTGNSRTFGGNNPTIKQRSFDAGTQRNWHPSAWAAGEAGNAQKTPDLTQMVQQVIDRNTGEALTFRFFGSTGGRIAKAMDAGTGAPVLHIEYQVVNGSSGSTTSGGSTTTTRVATRLELMQEALREVLEDAPNVNVGLMKYSGMNEYNFGDNNDWRNNFVGGIVFPVSPIYNDASSVIGLYNNRDSLPNPGTKSVREFIADVADAWEAEGGTPIVDALYEAALYFRGEQMHHGKNKNNTESMESAGSHPSSYFGGAEMPSRVDVVGRSAIANANYKSPIKSECQSNYMVLMSDGAPTYYYESASTWGESQGPFATELKGTNASELAAAIPSCLTGNGENADASVKRLNSGTCGREITQYLANNDQMPDEGRGSNNGVPNEQTVKTFVIGFGQDLEDGAEEYLRSLETIDGEGGYYTADNKAQLKAAFQNIFETVAQSSGSLASPGYSVNVKNGLEHEKDIYIPVFDRRATPMWSGNLKKFTIEDVNGRRLIRGSNGKNAVDALGGFTEDALDFWSDPLGQKDPDGSEVLKGGVAELINPDTRLALTDAGCTDSGVCNLTVAGNAYKLVPENTEITSALLDIDNQGLSDAAKTTKRRRLINFIRGWQEGFYDANATPKGYPRKHMGDMLHSEPVVITYEKGTENADGTVTGKKQFIFIGTNEGYLHAFDTSTGQEVFAFMPAELLKNIDTMFKDEGTAVNHKYGVDGSITYWHDDVNKNKEVDNGEKVYLYFGLRRGGRSYYALDISGLNAASPVVKRLWKKSSDDEGMSLLGQTWSPPYLAKVGFSGNVGVKEVMIVSGGYDRVEDRDKPNEPTVLDDSTKTVTTTMGHNIYILDAHTGDLLWSLRESMGDTQISDSIPGGLRMLDMNRNGLVDRLYFADTGGHVWRLDLSESLSKTGDSDSILTEFADLGGSGSNARKFYNEPDVAIMKPNGKAMLAVSIGSGFRAHPNDKEIVDRMFILRDTSPYQPLPDSFETITTDDLASVGISTSGDGNITLTHDGFANADKDKGWYLSLPDGEKVLAQAITFDGIIAFTTMVPQVLTENVDPCRAPKAYGRLYALNILTGEAVINLDDNEVVDDNDSYIPVVKGEIPGKPQIIFNKFAKKVIATETETGEVTKTSCSHPVDIRVGKKLSQVTGYDACRLESVYWNDPQPED